MKESFLRALTGRNVLSKGHFKLASGLHSDTYFQSARIYEDPPFFRSVVSELSSAVKTSCDKVAACAIGGIIPGYEVAAQLGKKFIFYERIGGDIALRRGFSVNKGEKFIIVEDVITTGGTVKEVYNKVVDAGGIVEQVICIALRAKKTPFDNLTALITIETSEYPPELCALCKKGTPLSIPGIKAMQ